MMSLLIKLLAWNILEYRFSRNFPFLISKAEVFPARKSLISKIPEAKFMNVQFRLGFWAYFIVLRLEISVYNVYINLLISSHFRAKTFYFAELY